MKPLHLFANIYDPAVEDAAVAVCFNKPFVPAQVLLPPSFTSLAEVAAPVVVVGREEYMKEQEELAQLRLLEKGKPNSAAYVWIEDLQRKNNKLIEENARLQKEALETRVDGSIITQQHLMLEKVHRESEQLTEKIKEQKKMIEDQQKTCFRQSEELKRWYEAYPCVNVTTSYQDQPSHDFLRGIEEGELRCRSRFMLRLGELLKK